MNRPDQLHRYPDSPKVWACAAQVAFVSRRRPSRLGELDAMWNDERCDCSCGNDECAVGEPGGPDAAPPDLNPENHVPNANPELDGLDSFVGLVGEATGMADVGRLAQYLGEAAIGDLKSGSRSRAGCGCSCHRK